MTPSSQLFIAFFIFIMSGSAFGDASIDNCPGVSSSEHALSRIECSSSGDVQFATYKDAEPISTYATDLDRRTVVVAASADSSALLAAAGFTGDRTKPKLASTSLTTPPFRDQIESHSIAKKVVNHNGWIVSTEVVQYRAQGPQLGFAIQCATAINLSSALTEPTAVSECFPMENTKRFLHTLDSIGSLHAQ